MSVMRATALLVLGSLTSLLASEVSSAESLDNYYDEIKTHGGLAGLCRARPELKECRLAIGEWKPKALERAKNRAPFCIDICKHDFFGFVQSSTGDREYPVVRTKDFSPGLVSDGVEMSLFPVAIEAYEYSACNGCNHVRTYPTGLRAVIGSREIELPALGRGIFYLPSEFRETALTQPRSRTEIVLTKPDGSERKARISIKALAEYAKMLQTLNYDYTIN